VEIGGGSGRRRRRRRRRGRKMCIIQVGIMLRKGGKHML
jgi:hypothetical protein